MSKLKVHMNDSVRLRLPSIATIGSLARWNYHCSVVQWSSQLWMIPHFEFAVREPRAPVASSFEDASTCARVLWARGTATWLALCASWLHSGCFRSPAPSRRRSKPASPPATRALVSELEEPEVGMVGHGQDRTGMLYRETDCHHLVAQRLQSGVARLEIRAGWPPRDDVVAARVRQIDRHRKGNQDRDSDDPRQIARLVPSVENSSESDSVVVSAGP